MTPGSRKIVKVPILQRAREAIAMARAVRDKGRRLHLMCEDTLRQVDRTREAVDDTLGRHRNPPNQTTATPETADGV